MLEYTKTILQKVSFDRDLFRKELFKSFRWLSRDEIIKLFFWAALMFSAQYEDILNEAFQISL